MTLGCESASIDTIKGFGLADPAAFFAPMPQITIQQHISYDICGIPVRRRATSVPDAQNPHPARADATPYTGDRLADIILSST